MKIGEKYTCKLTREKLEAIDPFWRYNNSGKTSNAEVLITAEYVVITREPADEQATIGLALYPSGERLGLYPSTCKTVLVPYIEPTEGREMDEIEEFIAGLEVE